MKKTIVLIVFLLGIIFYAFTASYTQVGTNLSDGYVFSDKKIQENLYSEKDEAVAASEVYGGEGIYKRLTSTYYGDENKVKVNSDFPIYINDGQAITLINGSESLISDDYETYSGFPNATLNEGYLFDISYNRADYETYIFTHLTNGLYINTFEIKVKTFLNEYTIPANSIIYFSTDSIRFYAFNMGTFCYDSIPDIEDTSILSFNGTEISFKDLLLKLGETIEYHDIQNDIAGEIKRENNKAKAEALANAAQGKTSKASSAGTTKKSSSSTSGDSSKIAKKNVAVGAAEKADDPEEAVPLPSKEKEDDKESPLIQDWVKPEVKAYDDRKAGVYTLSVKLDIKDPSNVIVNGLTFEVFIAEGEDAGQNYKRQSFSSSNAEGVTCLITDLEPDKKYYVNAYYKYYNEYRQIQEAVYFIDHYEFKTKDVSELAPITLELDNNVNLNYETVSIASIKIKEGSDMDTVGSMKRVNIRVYKDLVNYSGINLSSTDREKLISMQAISYTSAKGLQSNHEYSIKILCYDRFNNELTVYNNTVDTRTCKKMPTGKITQSYLTDDHANKIITSVALTPTIVNEDAVSYSKLYFKILKEDMTYLYVNGSKEITAIPDQATILEDLKPGCTYTATLYCIADNDDGQGKIERVITSKQFSTSEISQLGSLYLNGVDLTGRTYPDEMYERIYFSLTLNTLKTNTQLPNFVSYLNIVLKEKEGSSVSITLSDEKLAELLSGKTIIIDSNDFVPDKLSSYTNYSISYEAGYIDTSEDKTQKIPVSCNFASFKTARKPVAVLMTTPEAMTGYISTDITISDIDDYINGEYAILNIYQVEGNTTKLIATFQIDKNQVKPFELRMFNDASMSTDGKSYEIKGDTAYRFVFVGEDVNSTTGDGSNEPLCDAVDVVTTVGVEGNVSLKSLASKPDIVDRNLPEEYTQVEYIQINNDPENGYNNQILTDVKWKNIAEIESSICIVRKASSYNIFFTVNGGGAPYISYMDSAIYSYYSGYNVNCSPNYGRNKMMEKLTVQHITVTSTMHQNSSSKLAIGAYSNSSSYSGSYRVGYLKLYNSGSELIGDFVPCVRDADNVAGLYDFVTNKFYAKSRGTGTITYGERLDGDDYLIEEGKYKATYSVEISDETEWLASKTYYIDLFDMNVSTTTPINTEVGVYEGTGTNGVPREFTVLIDDDGMVNHNYQLQLYILTQNNTKIPLSTATFNTDEKIHTISNLEEFLAVQGLNEKYVVINDIIFDYNPYDGVSPYYYNGPWKQSTFNARIDFQGYKLSYYGNGPLLYVMSADSELTNMVFETTACYSRLNTTTFSRGTGDYDRGSGALVWNNRGTISNVKITYRQQEIGQYHYSYYWQDIDGYDIYGNYNPRYPYLYSANVICTNNGTFENFVVDIPDDIYASSYCGVVGENYAGTIRNGYVYSSNADMNYRVQLHTADNSNDSYYRGILCGRNYATGLIENVYVLGDINCNLNNNTYNYTTGIVCGCNYGITRNTYCVGNVTKSNAVLSASYGPGLGYNYGNTRYVKNNNYISEYTYTNTFNTATSAIALKSVSWQSSVLNESGDNFDIDSLVNSGCYPHVKYTSDYMPVQEYIYLPTMKLGSVDVLFSQLYKLGTDRAIDQELGGYITGDELRLTSEKDERTGIEYFSDVQLVQVYISDKTGSLVYGLKFSDTRMVAKCVKQVNDGTGVSLCYMIVYNPSTAVDDYKITDIIYQDLKGDAGTTVSVSKYSRYMTVPFYRELSNITGNDSWEYLRKNTSQNFRLYADLDFQNYSFKDIYVNNTFTGSLDGNGHTISNIKYESNPLKEFYDSYWDQNRNGGLFNYLSGADVYDLTINNFYCEGGFFCGSLAGKAANSYISNVYANDVYVCGVCNVGGLVGRADSSNEFISCGVNRAKIVLVGGENTSYTENCAGGLCGYVNLNNKFTRVYASSIYVEDISSSSRYIFSGGLFGYTYDLGTEVKGAYATGTIITSANSSGGVAGCCYSTVEFDSVYADVDIYTYSTQASGTIGWTRDVINGTTMLSFGDIILMSEATSTIQREGLFMTTPQPTYVSAIFYDQAKLILDSTGTNYAEPDSDNSFSGSLIREQAIYNYLSDSYFKIDTNAANGILPKLIDETKTELPYQMNNIIGYENNDSYIQTSFDDVSDYSEGLLTIDMSNNPITSTKDIEIQDIYYDFTFVDDELGLDGTTFKTYSKNETLTNAEGIMSRSTIRTSTTTYYRMRDAELNCAYDRYFITCIKYLDKTDNTVHYLRVNEVIDAIDSKQFKNINSKEDYKKVLGGTVAENFQLNCDIDFENENLEYYNQAYANTVINRLVGTKGDANDYLVEDEFYEISNAKLTLSPSNTEKFGFMLNGQTGVIRRTLSELSNIEFKNITVNRRRTSGVVGGVNGKVSGIVFTDCNVQNNTYYGYGEGLIAGATADCSYIYVDSCNVINKGSNQGSLLFGTYQHNYRLGNLENIKMVNSTLTSNSSYNGLLSGYWYGYFNFYTSTSNPINISNVTFESCSTGGSSYTSLFFGYTYNTYRKISDVSFKDCTVKGSSYVGAICGYMYNPVYYKNITCYNCTSRGTGNYVGMIAGQGYNAYYMLVEKCKVYGNGSYTGGVMGYLSGSSYISGSEGYGANFTRNIQTSGGNSYYYAAVYDSYIYGNTYVGGIGGYNGSEEFNAVVSNCEIKGNYYVGGICGIEAYAPYRNVVTNTTITPYADEGDASVKGISYRTNPHGFGGISGYYCTLRDDLVENCLIGASNVNYVGGFCGYGNIYASYNNGTNSICQDCIVLGYDYVGGMFGSLSIGTVNYNANFSNDVSNAYVVGHDYVGGIAGRVTGYRTTNAEMQIVFNRMGRVENCYFTGTLISECRAGALYGTILGNTASTNYMFRYVSSLPDYIRANNISPVFCESDDPDYGYNWSDLVADASPTFISLWADTKIYMESDSTVTTMKQLINKNINYSSFVSDAATVKTNFASNTAGDAFIVLYDSETVDGVTKTSSEIIDKYFYSRSLLPTRSTAMDTVYQYYMFYGYSDVNFTDYMPLVITADQSKYLKHIIYSSGDGQMGEANFITKANPFTGEVHTNKFSQGLAVPGTELYYQKLTEIESIYAAYQSGGVSAIGWGVREASVPESYTVLEYLKSTGSQYILLDYYHKSDTWVDMNVSFNSIYSNNTVYGAAKSDNSSDSMTFGIYTGGFNCDFGKMIQAKWAGLAVDTQYHVVWNAKIANVNGTQYNLNGNSTSSNYKTEIFGRNLKDSTYTNEIGQCAYYGLKIYEGSYNDTDNSTLMLDLVPVRENSTGELGMYDRINNKFYKNNGTGSFVAGPVTTEKITTTDEIDYSQFVVAYASGVDKLNIEFTDLYFDTAVGNPTIKIYKENDASNPIVDAGLNTSVYTLNYDYKTNIVVEFADDEDSYKTTFKATDLRNNIMLDDQYAYGIYNGVLYNVESKQALIGTGNSAINCYGGEVMTNDGAIYSVNNITVIDRVCGAITYNATANSLYDFTYTISQSDTKQIHTYATRTVVEQNSQLTEMSGYRLFVKNGKLISIKQGSDTAIDPLYVRYSGGESEILLHSGTTIKSIGTSDPISKFSSFVTKNVKKITGNLGNINSNNKYLLVEYINGSIVLYDMQNYQMVNTLGNLNGGNLLNYVSTALNSMFKMEDTSYNVTGQSNAAGQIVNYLNSNGVTLLGLVNETDLDNLDTVIDTINNGTNVKEGENTESSLINLTISSDEESLKEEGDSEGKVVDEEISIDIKDISSDLPDSENSAKEEGKAYELSIEEMRKVPNAEEIVERINKNLEKENEEIVVVSNKDKDSYMTVYDPETNEFEIYDETEFFEAEEPESEDSKIVDKTMLKTLYQSLGENEDETTTRGIVIYLIIAVVIICLLIPLWVLRKKQSN